MMFKYLKSICGYSGALWAYLSQGEWVELRNSQFVHLENSNEKFIYTLNLN